jgi:hypothetical protein
MPVRPTDAENIANIEAFLDENEIKFSSSSDTPEIINIQDKPLQIIYVNSASIKLGYKKFGYDGTTLSYSYDISKSQEDKGIRVIFWRDFEIADPRKNSVIKSYILTACGKVQNRIYARDCLIKPLEKSELRPFLSTNCFYGYRSASLNVGLYLKKDVGNLKKGTLVMMWSAGHAFYGKTMYDLEIIRAATLLNTQVIGGASRLFKHIINIPTIVCGGKEINWNSLCFYVDYDHNDGKSLPVIGFKFLNYSGGGFMNLNVETGEAFNRKPAIHKQVMQWMRDGKVISTPLSGVKTYVFCRDNNYSQFNIAPEGEKV